MFICHIWVTQLEGHRGQSHGVRLGIFCQLLYTSDKIRYSWILGCWNQNEWMSNIVGNPGSLWRNPSFCQRIDVTKIEWCTKKLGLGGRAPKGKVAIVPRLFPRESIESDKIGHLTEKRWISTLFPFILSHIFKWFWSGRLQAIKY